MKATTKRTYFLEEQFSKQLKKLAKKGWTVISKGIDNTTGKIVVEYKTKK